MMYKFKRSLKNPCLCRSNILKTMELYEYLYRRDREYQSESREYSSEWR